MILFQIMVLYAGERCDHMANENKNNKEKFEGDDFMFQLTKIILDYDTDDEKIYLCGGSSKDAGARITSILEDPDRAKYDSMIKDLLKNNQLILK